MGAQTGANSHGPIAERLRSSRAELSKGVAGMTPTVVKYWLEAPERILDNMECTPCGETKPIAGGKP